MGQLFRNWKDTEQELILDSDSEEVISSDNDSGHDEDATTVSCDNFVNGSQVYIWSRPQHPWDSCDVHPSGLKIHEASHVNSDFAPVNDILIFMKVI